MGFEGLGEAARGSESQGRAGKARHFDQVYDGEHEAIIERTTFQALQTLLAGKAPNRRSRSSSQDVHLLTGLVYDETGDRLSPTHAYNHGKRYRYYISKRLRHNPSAKEGSWRIPADELERIALQQAKGILQDRTLMAGWLQDNAIAVDRIEGAFLTASGMVTTLQEAATPEPRKQILQMMFGKITLSPAKIRFEINKQALIQRLLAAMDGEAVDHGTVTEDGVASGRAEDQPLLIERAIAIKRRGIEARIIICGEAGRDPDSSLVDLIARAHFYLWRLTDGSVSSIAELAGELSVHRADISRILPLAFLSPDVTDMILTGHQPADLSVRTLSRLVDVSPAWTDQTQVIGT